MNMYVCGCGTDLPLVGARIPFSDHKAGSLAAAGLLHNRPTPTGDAATESTSALAVHPDAATGVLPPARGGADG